MLFEQYCKSSVRFVDNCRVSIVNRFKVSGREVPRSSKTHQEVTRKNKEKQLATASDGEHFKLYRSRWQKQRRAAIATNNPQRTTIPATLSEAT